MKTVLLLEDDEVSCALYQRVLRRCCRVLTASSPCDAISTAGTEALDLFIADNVLGGPASGAETLYRVHEEHPRLSLLLVSGTPPEGFSAGDFDLFARLVRAGACEFLQKPFTTDTFMSKVARMLESGPDAAASGTLLSSAIDYRKAH